MSFEDDMIEEGFHDEQEYLDYLCSKADKGFRSIHADNKANHNRQLEEDSHIRAFRKWKQTDSDEACLWNLIWINLYMRDCYIMPGGYYERERREYMAWNDWRKGDQYYTDWVAEHKEELEELEKNEFIKTFINYCSDFIDKNGTPFYLKTNNSRLMTRAGISLNDAHYNDKDLDVAIWSSAVNDSSQENVLFDYWELDHKQEWANWQIVNYPYVKDFIIQNNESLSNLIHNIKEFRNLEDAEKERLKHIIISIAQEQMDDWWGLFVEDTKKKYAKAVELDYDDLFLHIGVDTSSPESFEPIEGLLQYPPSLLYESKSSRISASGRKRPLSHPELKRVKAVLPGAYNDNLISKEVSIEEMSTIWDEENTIYSELAPINPFGEEEGDIDENKILERWKIKEAHQKALLDSQSLDARFELLPKELQNYISTLPKDYPIDYEDYQYQSVPNLIYYFCKEKINIENIDCLISDSSSIDFIYKGYNSELAFANNELAYDRFNQWCYNHNLPTFTDYIIKYWFKDSFNENTALLKVWLKFWRGQDWIYDNFGYKKKSKEELFDIWMEHHKEEWDSFRNDSMYKSIRDAICHLWLLFDWIKKGNYKLEEILKYKKNDGVRCYHDKLNKEFESWLVGFAKGWSLPAWKDKHTSLIPALQEHYKKVRLLKLWNDAHKDEEVLIPGVNDFSLHHPTDK